MAADHSSYYDMLRAKAHAVHPDLVGEEDLFQSLLLALVAMQKHVIVRTLEDDVPRISKLVVNILHILFALSVVKLRLRPADKLTADDFLRLLFLQSPVGHTSRASSRKVLNGSQNMPFRRTSSYPVAYGTGLDESLSSPPMESRQSYTPNGSSHHRMSLMRTQTDPSPSLFQSAESHKQDVGTDLLPQALVVSGLEHTSDQVQSALWTSLARGRLATGHHSFSEGQQGKTVWPLPNDFLVVYVCPIGNGCERPPIHNSLIDRFAMNVEVYPLPEQTGNRVSQISVGEIEEIQPPIISPRDLAELQRFASPLYAPIASRLDLYLSDLFSATRHYPHLDGILLTVRCRRDTEQLIRASRVLFGPLPSASPVSPSGKLVLDISDEEIRKNFVRAVQHRLRVLDGPRQEILSSLIFGAASNIGDDAEWKTGRRTVKEILKEIVDTV